MKWGQSVKCHGQISGNVPCRLENKSLACRNGNCNIFDKHCIQYLDPSIVKSQPLLRILAIHVS